MSRLMTLLAAVAALFVLSLAGPADAAQRDGIKKQQAGQYEVSDQRRYRRYYRRHYRPYYGYRPYYYGGYPGYYGYGYPYGYYGAPGIGFQFRF